MKIVIAWTAIVIAASLGALAFAVAGNAVCQYFHGHSDVFIVCVPANGGESTESRPIFSTSPLPFIVAVMGVALIFLATGLHLRERHHADQAKQQLEALGVKLPDMPQQDR
jgi:hypothetical protein